MLSLHGESSCYADAYQVHYLRSIQTNPLQRVVPPALVGSRHVSDQRFF